MRKAGSMAKIKSKQQKCVNVQSNERKQIIEKCQCSVHTHKRPKKKKEEKERIAWELLAQVEKGGVQVVGGVIVTEGGWQWKMH